MKSATAKSGGEGDGVVIRVEGGEAKLRLMTAADEDAVLRFASSLPTHDLLFLPRDISQPKVLRAWIVENERGGMTTMLAVRGEDVLGCATIVRDELSWSPHVGEVRVVVAANLRGKGVGRALAQAMFSVALKSGLEKITAQMTVDQRGAIAVFESLGFRGEALLRGHVRDRDGGKHDIVILSHDVAQVEAQMQAYGVTDALA